MPPPDLPLGLVPEEMPPESAGPWPSGTHEAAPVPRRIVGWTTALANHAVRQDWFWRLIRPRPQAASFVTAGFIRGRDGAWRFGLCVRVPPTLDAVPVPPGIEMGGQTLPVVVMESVFEQHQPGHPAGGTAACWARARAPSRTRTPLPADGVLSAAHVLYGAFRVPAGVYGIRSLGLDAAVQHPATVSGAAGPLAVSGTVSATSSHDIHCTGRTPPAIVPATVLQVFQPTAFVAHLIPHRIVTDVAAAPGDSGALVRDATTGAASGLYIGRHRDSSGTVRGACQIMAQVCDELDIDLLL